MDQLHMAFPQGLDLSWHGSQVLRGNIWRMNILRNQGIKCKKSPELISEVMQSLLLYTIDYQKAIKISSDGKEGELDPYPSLREMPNDLQSSLMSAFWPHIIYISPACKIYLSITDVFLSGLRLRLDLEVQYFF